MDTLNAYPDHIGVLTIDRNVSHEIWPCVSHPPEMRCRDALAWFSRKGHRTLSPAPRSLPARDFVPPR